MNINIIKIGTNILTTKTGSLDLNNLKSLTDQICELIKNTSNKFIIVTSGAITCGSTKMKIKANSIPEKQAAASVGQFMLMNEYANFFNQNSLIVGQILLTKNCIIDQTQTTNAKNTIFTLLENNIIPIINENDSLATDEIDNYFGDNDNLSSIVAKLVKANKLILLTDIDGVFTENPKINKDAKLIKELDNISDTIINNIEDEKNTRSRGGMKSKLLSAKAASESGTEVIIANGRKENIIRDIFNKNFIGTLIKKNQKN
jgi:glutamate 5-kinase